MRKTYEVPLQEVTSSRELAQGSTRSDDESGSENEASIDLLGLTVQPLDQDAVRQLELESDQRGVLVTSVTPGGPAYGEVAEPGRGGPDIILELEGKPVRTPAQLKDALKGFKAGDIVSLRIYNTQAKTRRIERIRLGD